MARIQRCVWPVCDARRRGSSIASAALAAAACRTTSYVRSLMRCSLRTTRTTNESVLVYSRFTCTRACAWRVRVACLCTCVLEVVCRQRRCLWRPQGACRGKGGWAWCGQPAGADDDPCTARKWATWRSSCEGSVGGVGEVGATCPGAAAGGAPGGSRSALGLWSGVDWCTVATAAAC